MERPGDKSKEAELLAVLKAREASTRQAREKIDQAVAALARVERGEPLENIQMPDEAVAMAEVENMPETERRETAKGLYNLGFRVEKQKNNIFAGIFNYASKKFGDEKDTTARFCAQMRDSFIRDAEIAERKAKDLAEGKGNWVMKLQNPSLLVGNVLKYGRLVADATGLTPTAASRITMTAGMVMARVSEAAKETRLSNEKLIDQTRFGVDREMSFYDAETGQFDQDAQMSADIARAQEEAFRVYEGAGGVVGSDTEKASIKDLQSAYQVEIPKNLKERLENPENTSRVARGIVEKVILNRINSLNKKIQKIKQDDNLTREQKKLQTEQLVNGLRWRKALRDYDRMITSCGTIDELAFLARTSQKIGKGIVLATQLETLVISVEKMWGMASHFLSSPDAHEIVASQTSAPRVAPRAVQPDIELKSETTAADQGLGKFEFRGEPQDVKPMLDELKQMPSTPPTPETDTSHETLFSGAPRRDPFLVPPEPEFKPLDIPPPPAVPTIDPSSLPPKPPFGASPEEVRKYNEAIGALIPRTPPTPGEIEKAQLEEIIRDAERQAAAKTPPAPEDALPRLSQEEIARMTSEAQPELTASQIPIVPDQAPLPPAEIPHGTSVEDIRRALEEKYDTVTHAEGTSAPGITEHLAESPRLVDHGYRPPENLPVTENPRLVDYGYKPLASGGSYVVKGSYEVPGSYQVGGYNQPYAQPLSQDGLPSGQHGENYIDLSPRENLIIQTHPELAKNPFNLSGRELVETYYTNRRNLAELFPGEEVEAQRIMSHKGAIEIFKENTNVIRGLNPEKRLSTEEKIFDYMLKLRRLTGLKPKSRTLFNWGGEAADKYIARALQKAVSMGVPMGTLRELVKR